MISLFLLNVSEVVNLVHTAHQVEIGKSEFWVNMWIATHADNLCMS